MKILLKNLSGRNFGLFIDGVDVRPDIQYSSYSFSAVGVVYKGAKTLEEENKNGVHFDVAKDLGLIKIDRETYEVTDLKKFDDFISSPKKEKGPGILIGAGEVVDGKYYP
jgi:hypothetical protein